MAVCISSDGEFIPLSADFIKCLKGDHAEYEIVIKAPGQVQWTILKRYREFRALHEKLVKYHDLKDLVIPPKKAFNNLSTEFLQQRQADLQTYLRGVLEHYPLPPKPIADFIEWRRYEIHGITSDLSKKLFEHGETILSGGFPFELSVYQLHAINERMKSAAPTNIGDGASSDFGHVMDFVSRLQSLKIRGSTEKVERSNIKMNSLDFDLSPFHKIMRLELINVDLRQMRGFSELKKTAMTLVVHRSLDNIQHLMLGDLYSAGHGEWVFGSDPVPTTGWDKVTVADFSENFLHGLDPSMALMRNLERLDLSGNNLTEIAHLDVLPHLTSLLLSRNKLGCLDPSISREETTEASGPLPGMLHTRLGNVKELRLDSNGLRSALLVDKLYSLQRLDLSSNDISTFVDILCLGRLRCLEELFLHSNPLCLETNYRRNVFDIFGSRFTEVSLDGSPATQAEAEMVRLFRALKQGQSAPAPDASGVYMDIDGPLQPYACTISLPLAASVSTSVRVRRPSKAHLDPLWRLTLSNQKLHNFVLYNLFSVTGRHHTVSHLTWALHFTSREGEVSPPETVCLTVSAQDASLLVLRLRKIIEKPPSSTTASSAQTAEPTPPPEQRYSLTAGSALSTSMEAAQLVLGAGAPYLRLDRGHASPNSEVFLLRSPAQLDCLLAALLKVEESSTSSSLRNSPRDTGDLRVVQLDADARQMELLAFVNHWRRGRHLAALSRLDYERPALLRFPNGYSTVFTVVVAGGELCVIDEKWSSIPRPPQVDPRAASMSRLSDWRSNLPHHASISSLSSSPLYSPVDVSSPSSHHGPVQPYGRMGHYSATQLTSYIPLERAVTGEVPLHLPYPEFENRVLVKIKVSRTPPARRKVVTTTATTAAGSRAADVITSLDFGFDSHADLNGFVEALEEVMRDARKEQMPSTSAACARPILIANAEFSGATSPEEDNALELLPFRNLSRSYDLVRVRLIPLTVLAELSTHSPQELLHVFQTLVNKAQDEMLEEAFWTSFLPCEESLVHGERAALVFATNRSLHLLHELVEPPEDSAPESDQSPRPTLGVVRLPLGALRRVYVGLCSQWVRLSGGLPEEDVTLVTRSAGLTDRIVAYLRAVLGEGRQGDAETGPSYDEVVQDPGASIYPTPSSTVSSSSSSTDGEEAGASASGVERLAGRRVKLEFAGIGAAPLQEMMASVWSGTKDPSARLLHYLLLEDARVDFKELSKQWPSVLGLVVTDRHLCIVGQNVAQYPVSRYARTPPDTPRYKVLDIRSVLDLERLSLASHDPRELVLSFGGVPDSLDTSRFPNYYSARPGLEAALEPVLVELVVASEKERKILIKKIRQRWTEARDGRAQLRVCFD